MTDADYLSFYRCIEDALRSGYEQVIVRLDENGGVIVEVEAEDFAEDWTTKVSMSITEEKIKDPWGRLFPEPLSPKE